MADLSKELPLEKLNDESWAADKSTRKAKAASINPINNQMAWCNTNTDHLGDLIRHFGCFQGINPA